MPAVWAMVDKGDGEVVEKRKGRGTEGEEEREGGGGVWMGGEREEERARKRGRERRRKRQKGSVVSRRGGVATQQGKARAGGANSQGSSRYLTPNVCVCLRTAGKRDCDWGCDCDCDRDPAVALPL